MSNGAHFRFGVNYWPARTGMYWWQDFRIDECARDFARIAQWGMTEARIFLLWEEFQDSRGRVVPGGLRSLEKALGAAERSGLRLVVTLFCGHMSGANFLPGFVLVPRTGESVAGGGEDRFPVVSGGSVVEGCAVRDLYADPLMLEAQVDLVRALVRAVGRHPALLGWDLGNEFSNVRIPQSPADAAKWSAILSAELREGGGLITGGCHSEDLEEDRNLRLSSLGAPWDHASMHGYPIYSKYATDPLDPDWVPVLCDAAWGMSQRPVLAQEFGLASTPGDERIVTDGVILVREEEAARYADAVLERLAGMGALGALWWCFSDYPQALAGTVPFRGKPHELAFGLLRADGSEKPVLRVWRDWIERGPLVPGRTVTAIREEEWYADPASAIRERQSQVWSASPGASL